VVTLLTERSSSPTAGGHSDHQPKAVTRRRRSPTEGGHTKTVDPSTTYSGKIAVIPGDDIDTDRIIPARFLSRVSRSGYGELLFHDVRGPEFILDKPEAAGTTILVVGTNFGCGSSREHAVWAIQQGGYRAVIARQTDSAPGFGDIFRQNAANCGLLLAECKESDHARLTAEGTGSSVEIDLPNETIFIDGQSIRFEINQVTKQALIAGLDLIGTTLLYANQIDEYESKHDSYAPAR
jgi:3-isopropylmalate/(R)-2-methylmalate dehydratase small subunit